jgi:hypothetical protein
MIGLRERPTPQLIDRVLAENRWFSLEIPLFSVIRKSSALVF